MPPARVRSHRARLSVVLLAVALLAACTTSRSAEPGEPRAGSRTETPATATSTADSDSEAGGALCESVDVEVVRSVVGVRDVPDPATTAVDTGSGWTCTWFGDYRSTGPNGQVAQPKVDVILYRAPLEITEGGEVPTTVAGRAGTINKLPGRCVIRVTGTERTLVVDAATVDPDRGPCPQTRTIAEPLVKQFIQ
jgi:hypothetical protein